MGSADFRLIRPVGVTADGAFTRPSPKWVFDGTGTLIQVPAGSFAVTYDPMDMTKAPYALVEPAATNLITYSENLVAGWTGSAVATLSGADFHGVPYYYVTKTNGGTSEFRQHYVGAKTAGQTVVATLALRAGSTDSATVGLYDWTVGGPGWGATADATIEIDGPGTAYFQTGGAFYISGLSSSEDTFVKITRVYQLVASNTALLIYPGTVNSSTIGHSVQATRVQVEVDRATSYIRTAGVAVTRAADDIASGAGLVYSNVPITEPNYSSTATYAKDAQVYDPSSRLVYESLADANTGKALTDTTAWTPQLATNRWQMFDKAVNSQTSAPDLLVVAIKPGQLVNAVGLLNVAGSSVTVTQTDSYYVQTKSLVRHDVLGWYDFFYEEPIREGDVMFDGIPPYANSTLVITVTNQGDAAAIGCCVLGKSRTIGQTAWDFTGGVLSYSSSATDKFGNVTLVKRDNSKVLNFEVYIPSGFESEAYRLLRECTDVELMIVGAEDYSMTYSYGYLGQWTVPVTNGVKTAHIEFKGLV